MSAQSGGNVAIRFSVQDAEVVRKALESLGKDGEAALKRMSDAARNPSRSMQALGDATGYLRSQVTGSAQSLGLAGDMLSRFGVVGLVAGAAIGAIAYGFTAMLDRAKNVRVMASDVKDSAAQARLSAEEFQAFSYVLVKHGVAADAAKGGILRFNAAHAAAIDGGGELYSQIQKVNGALAEEFAIAKSGPAAIDAFLRAWGVATERQRVVLERTAFGRSGGVLTEALGDLAARGGLEGVTKAAKAAGVILEEQVIQKLDTAQKKSEERAREVERNWNAVAVSIAGKWKEAWAGLAEEYSSGVNWSRNVRAATSFILDKSVEDAKKLQAEIDVLQGKIDFLRGKSPAPSWLDAIYLGAAKLSGAADLSIRALQSQIDSRQAGMPATPAPGAAPSVGEPTVEAQIRQLEATRKQLGLAIFSANPEDVAKYASQLSMIDARLKELRGSKQAVANQPMASPSEATDREERAGALAREIKLERERLGLLGDRAQIEDRIALAEKESRLERLAATPRISAVDKVLIDATNEARLRGAEIAKRTQFGVATETERRAQFERELNLAIADGTVKETDRALVMANYNKTLRETIEQETVRRSTTPALTQLSIDAGNLTKTLDQELASGLRGITGDLKQMRAGAISTGDGFRQMGTRILDAVQNALAMKLVVGPLAGLLTGGTSGLLSAFSPVKSARGNVFAGGRIIPFASGGIIDRPTLSPLASGNWSLTPEFGIEAPMVMVRERCAA